MSIAAEFIRALIPHVQAALRRNPKPLLLIDENLDQEPVRRTANALFAARLAWAPDEAWSTFQGWPDGPVTIVHPPERKHDRDTLPPGLDPGPRARDLKWPDRRVVEQALLGFLNHDRVVLLTGDTHMDAEGLPKILREEVRPALDQLHLNRLSLLVIINT